MTNIICKDGIAVYRFNDNVALPTDGIAMIEITTIGSNAPVRIGGGDINSSNSALYNDVADIPADYAAVKYLYDGAWSLNPDYEE